MKNQTLFLYYIYVHIHHSHSQTIVHLCTWLYKVEHDYDISVKNLFNDSPTRAYSITFIF